MDPSMKGNNLAVGVAASSDWETLPSVQNIKVLNNLICPAGHELRRFSTEREGPPCSACKSVFGHGAILYGCYDCNYNLCKGCLHRRHASDAEAPNERLCVEIESTMKACGLASDESLGAEAQSAFSSVKSLKEFSWAGDDAPAGARGRKFADKLLEIEYMLPPSSALVLVEDDHPFFAISHSMQNVEEERVLGLAAAEPPALRELDQDEACAEPSIESPKRILGMSEDPSGWRLKLMEKVRKHRLAEMGFDIEEASQIVMECGTLEEAANKLAEKGTDPDDGPSLWQQIESWFAEDSALGPLGAQLMQLGFTERQALEAEKRCSTVEAAVEYLTSQQ